MMTNLDLLVLVFMGLTAAGLLAICLMFLIRKSVVKKICFYLLAVEGMGLACMNALMTPSSFPGELAFGWLLGILSVAALLLELCGKSEKRFMIARILVTVSVVAGMLNAFM